MSDVGKLVLKSCVDVSCTVTECFFKKLLNLDPVPEVMHDTIDCSLDPSDTDYEAYKYLASYICEKLHSLFTARFSLFSMYSLREKSHDNYELTNACTSSYRQTLETDQFLLKLKLLMYKPRKRGICVYM